MSTREHNISLMASLISNSSRADLKTIPLNKELFGMLAYPECFKQCARTDIDIIFKEEMQCTYKCVITYKQAFSLIREIEN